jgi:hypothetical protein
LERLSDAVQERRGERKAAADDVHENAFCMNTSEHVQEGTLTDIG